MMQTVVNQKPEITVTYFTLKNAISLSIRSERPHVMYHFKKGKAQAVTIEEDIVKFRRKVDVLYECDKNATPVRYRGDADLDSVGANPLSYRLFKKEQPPSPSNNVQNQPAVQPQKAKVFAAPEEQNLSTRTVSLNDNAVTSDDVVEIPDAEYKEFVDYSDVVVESENDLPTRLKEEKSETKKEVLDAKKEKEKALKSLKEKKKKFSGRKPAK